MTQRVKIAFAAGAAVIAATGTYFAVSALRSVPDVQRRLNLMATVTPDTEFRIVRRRPENNAWDDGTPYDRASALALLSALATAAPWDGKGHAAVYSPWDTQSPPLTIDLEWCKDMKDKAQRDKSSIAMCYGNWLFWYGDTIYQVSQESHEVLNRLLRENR